MNLKTLLLAAGSIFAGAADGAPVPSLTSFKDCPECPTMVRLPPMPTAEGTKPLAAAQTELTWREYGAAVRDGSCKPPYKDYPTKLHDMSGGALQDDYPVTGVSIEEVDCYLTWLKSKTGHAYRVPSGVEWEYLARAGAQTRFPWGDALGQDNAAVVGAFDRVKLHPTSTLVDPRNDVRFGGVYPVGRFKPNAWGLFDVVGNASEMTSERRAPRPECLKLAQANQCTGVVARGGSAVLLKDASPFDHQITWIAASPTWGIRVVRN